jgi:hypothetical protein
MEKYKFQRESPDDLIFVKALIDNKFINSEVIVE